MKVHVCYFAVFRELTGVGEETVETSAADVGSLFAELMRRHAGLVQEPAALVAINDEMSGWSAPLADGDRVLFFPPVAGG
jgi:MoaD family protein